MTNTIWIKIYKIPILGRKFFNYVVKQQGGPARSVLIREYYKGRNVNVGMFTYGGCFSEYFNRGGEVNIGRYCSIAENVRYFGANHPVGMLSQSAFFYNRAFGFNVKDVDRSQLNIGNDVWIGYGAIITAGCKTIGNGAVIGAGSVVTRDIPPYAIVAGNPARIIRMRFSEEIINEIEVSKWWTKSPEELYKYYAFMNNPKMMVEKMRADNGE